MLGETIQSLRKKQGLTQEQLAERIDVSRQAVSKWETGAAVPDLDKLQALSAVFNVTLDELVGNAQAEGAAKDAPQEGGKAGLILCATGITAMVVVGLIGLFSPSAAARMDASSVITINGTGIALTICAGVAAMGLVLHARRKRR